MMETIKSWLAQPLVAEYPLVWQLLVIVVLMVIGSYAMTLTLRHLRKQTERTANIWDDALFESLEKPGAYLIAVVGVSWALELIDQEMAVPLLDAVPTIRNVLVVVLFVWFLARMVEEVERRLLDPKVGQQPIDGTTVLAVSKLLRGVIIVLGILIIMQSLGFSVSGVLAFGGIGGIAVGFAAKDLLANFFGGLMIYMDRPFVVGDWIRSPDKEIEGVVEYVGWRLTRIRTFDKRPLYVPNNVFTQITVENPSRMLNRRIYETIGVRYDDVEKVPAIITDVRDMLEQHPDIDTEQTIIVNFDKFSSSSLDFFIYTYTKTTAWVEYHGIKQDVLLKISDIIAGHGAEIAFPTSTVHVPEQVLVSMGDQGAPQGAAP